MSGPKKDLIFLMDDPEDDRYNINDLVLQNPYTPNDQFLSYFNKNSKYGKNVPAGFLFIEASKKLMQKLQSIIKNGKSVMTHDSWAINVRLWWFYNFCYTVWVTASSE